MTYQNLSSLRNPLGLWGIAFVEFASPKPKDLDILFRNFGFSKTHFHPERQIDLYRQNEIIFLLNQNENSAAKRFSNLHGPSISSMGWFFENPHEAFSMAVSRGARPFLEHQYASSSLAATPAIFGIGDSIIYFIDKKVGTHLSHLGFHELKAPEIVPSKGFTRIDHLTNNVPNGSMQVWADFYKNIFGFTEVRYFDIKGVKTGLQSYALRSPCGSFCIPINEAKDEKSQINEYLREYNGPGIQHLAFLTNDIISSIEAMSNSGIETLDIDPEYYNKVFQRVRRVTEDKVAIQKNKILVDGDEAGYLLQIFTKNLVGPIFIEIIQRKNHLSFGEGNFAALFRSIERDQEKRGVFGKEAKCIK